MELVSQIDFKKLNKAAVILKTVAHPTRLAVVNLLDIHEELSVNELLEYLDCEQSLLSHHLKNMRNRGLLSTRKQGLQVYYRLEERDITGLLACIENCNCNM